MFLKEVTVDQINHLCKDTMVSYLEMEFTEIGPDYLVAKMPVNDKTRQPLGLLHGGASVALAETLGSIAATLMIDDDHYPVGLEINANHIRSAKAGVVTGKTVPIHVGKRTQVWNIEIRDEEEKLISTSRITLAILSKKH